MDIYYLSRYPKDKETGERPFFFALKDDDHELLWLIPISSKVEKYEAILNKHPHSGYICYLYGHKQSVVLTQNIIPAKIEHIERAFTVNSIHYILKNEKTKKEILKRAKAIISIIKYKDIPFFKDVKNLYQHLKKQ